MATLITHRSAARFMPHPPNTPLSGACGGPNTYRRRKVCFESPREHSQTHPPRFISPKPPKAPKEYSFSRRKYSKLRPLKRQPSVIREDRFEKLMYTPLELEIREKRVLISKEKVLHESTHVLVTQLRTQIEKQQEVIELQNDQLTEQEEEIRVLRATQHGVNLQALSKSF